MRKVDREALECEAVRHSAPDTAHHTATRSAKSFDLPQQSFGIETMPVSRRSKESNFLSLVWFGLLWFGGLFF
jgi:hypothetical protein